MPITHHSKFTKGKLIWREVKERSTVDKHTGNKITFKQALIDYDHPNSARGKPSFEICKVTYPMGINKEDYKLTGFATFDLEDPDVLDCIDDPERTMVTRFGRKKDFKVSMKNGTATAKKDTQLYEEADGEVMSEIEKDTVLIYEDETDDEEWVQVKVGGKAGFFHLVMNEIAELLFENRASIGFPSLKNAKDVLSKMKSPIYWHRDKETGNINMSKRPSSYLKNSYFAPRPPKDGQPGSKESFVTYSVPGMNENLSLDTMAKSSITVKPVLTLTNVYIGAGRFTPQFYVTSGVVYSVDEINRERVNEQQDTMNEASNDEALVKKLKEQLAASKNYAAPVSPMASPSSEDHGEVVPENTATPSLAEMLDDGPKIKKVDLDNQDNQDDDDDDDVKIPGLDNL